MSRWPLRQAARLIRAGGLVAYPTEAVYGLGCDPLNESAVQRLLDLKRRPRHKGVILVAADAQQLRPWIRVTDTELARMQATWPGPQTWVVPATSRVPAWIRGDHEGVAVRVSGHPLARQLARLAGTPVVSTSANLSGRPALRRPWQVAALLGADLDAVVYGACDLLAKPSTIVDLHSGALLRR